jgi:peptidoglycan hydrolase-like protein with peptidoglycan-binding domain
MNRTVLTIIASLFLMIAVARADETTRSVQAALKEQGFYYGDVNGQKDADTTAAIRRFQIRNGLQVTGEATSETLRSLGIRGAGSNSAAAPVTRPIATPTPLASDLRDDDATERTDRITSPPPQAYNQRPPQAPNYAPPPYGFQPDATAVFEGTPYEIAPPDLQRHVMVGVQTLLARRGFYGSAIDGVFGPGTELAVRAFQARVGIAPNGRLNIETLAALGLLPGQHAPGIAVPPRRFERRPRP